MLQVPKGYIVARDKVYDKKIKKIFDNKKENLCYRYPRVTSRLVTKSVI